MFFLLYKLIDDGVFDDFPKISDHFPKISEDFPKLFRRPNERFRTFSENLRKFVKMSEDSRRLSRKTRRCFDDTPTNLSTIKEANLILVKSSISSDVKISISYLLHHPITKGPRNQAFVLSSPAFTGTQNPSCVYSFFFTRPTDPSSREGGRWQTKHFIGMA